jgi:hypothetical protein
MSTPRFVLATGAQLSPEEYGYMALRLGSESAIRFVNECLGEGTFAASLTLARAVRSVRFAADIYSTTMEVGIYLWYAASVLKVDGETMARVAKGVSDGLAGIIAPNGEALDAKFREFLLQQAYSFALAFEKDERDSLSTDSAPTYRPSPLPSTALLLDILHRSNSNDPQVLKQMAEDQSSPQGLWLRNMIESSTLATVTALAREFRIKYEQ